MSQVENQSDEVEHGTIIAFDHVTGAGIIRPDLLGMPTIRFYIPRLAPCRERVEHGERVTYIPRRRPRKGRALFAFKIKPE